MHAPFAALQQRVNSAVAGRLSNAIASFAGSAPFGVVFDRGPADALGLVEAYGARVGFALDRAPGIAQGSTLTVDGVPYVVAGGVEPDSAGWVTLPLREPR